MVIKKLTFWKHSETVFRFEPRESGKVEKTKPSKLLEVTKTKRNKGEITKK